MSPRRSAETRRALGLAFGVFLCAAPAAPAAPAAGQGGETARIADRLPELRAFSALPDRAAAALLALAEVLAAFDERRDAAGELPAMEAELYLRALEYRARAHLTRGEVGEAAEDFRAVLLADPGWRPDVADITPAAVDLFEAERGELVAYLTVETEPAGGIVFLGEEPLGQTPLVARPVFAGTHAVRVERPGYAVVSERAADLFPGEVLALSWELDRVGPVLSVITAPAGVTVRVDGRVAGLTGGALPEDLRPAVPPRFADEVFSAPLMLSGLTLGAHDITLEAPCRRPSRFVFHADEPRDYLPRFVRLRPSTGGLRIESEPSGGRVWLDGEERGVTPLSFSAMCSGEHRVDIRHPAGRCVRSVSVSRGSRAAVRCALRPVAALDGGGPEGAGALAAVRRVLEGSEEFFFAGGPGEAEAADIQARIRVRLPPPAAGEASVEFLAAGSAAPDRAPFDRFAPETAADALRGLLDPPERRRPWIGATVALRRPPEGGAPVLEIASVWPEGPAGLAGVEPGDEVRLAGGEQVFDELGFAGQLARHAPGSALDLLVARDRAERRLRLVVSETPVLPARSGHRCNRRLTELDAAAARGDDDPFDRLEAGVCRLLLGDPAGALSREFPEVELPPGPGIGQGTVFYYRGLALLAVGERERAARDFAAAAEVPGATLVTHDGPLLAPLALRRAVRLR